MNDFQPIQTMIVPTLNGHGRLSALIDSIDHFVNHLVVISNTRTDIQLTGNKYVDTVDVISLPSNIGVAAAWNLGIKVTPFSEHWFMVNDDVTFPPGAIAQFAFNAELYANDLITANDMSPWCAFIVPEYIIDKVGLFDEAFYPAYFEDTDYIRRIEHYCGVNAIYNSDVRVNHLHSATIGSGYTEQNHRTYHENYRTFEDKLSLNRYEPIGWSLAIRRANDWGQP